MIEVLIALAGTVFGVLLSLVVGRKMQKNGVNDNEVKKAYKNKDFEELQGAIDDLRGNPVAIDDKIRDWLRK